VVASVTDALLHDHATSSAPTQAAPSVALHTDELSAQLAAALVRIGKLENDCAEYKKLVALLQEANERLQRGLTGHKAERFAPGDSQMSLAILQLALQASGAETTQTTSPEAETQTVAEHERRKPVRKPLPEHLPRVPIEIIPEHVKREGLDAFERIGADTREVIERRPASAVVVQLIYPKFVRKDRARNEATEVLVAPPVEMPIERGLAGPTLLADTIVRRWADHQPLSRQEGILAREGLDLAKSTICGWHETLSELAGPLVAAMFVDALSCPYLCVDATGVLVQAPERCKVGHFWVMVAPEKHVLYRFSARHDAKAVDALLAGYSGYLVADAHAVYDHLYRDGAVIEVACWSHCRRYWFKALESDPDRAKLGLSLVGELFRIERAIADAPRKKREAIRSARSKPVVQKFFRWCESQRDDVLDESPVATAIGYALNQRGALSRFLDDGRLPLHNNLSELNLRRQVLGRRNWLFLGSEDGATANTTFVTLLASCRLHDLEPLGYIRDLLCLLPSWPRHRVLDLAPAYWQQTLEQPETQQKLDANVFRRVTLGLPPLA
jgi:transposase